MWLFLIAFQIISIVGSSAGKLDYDDIFDGQPLRILGLDLRDESCSGKIRAQSGSCQPWDRCLKLNGVQGESCAYGFGVCCYWQTSCGAQTSSKVSQFVNPSYPGSDTVDEVSGAVRDCRFTIRVSDKKVCQLRLDFEAFHLSEPEEDRMAVRCVKQRFQIRRAYGVGLGFSELCGDNAGQHLYIPVDATLGTTTVQMVITTLRGASAYRWKIKTTQIDCSKDKSLVAPTDCLQYYTADTGSFRSLGYGRSSSFRGVPSNAAMPAGLDYAICIKRQPNSCGIMYSSPEMAFNLPTSSNSSTAAKPESSTVNSTTSTEATSTEKPTTEATSVATTTAPLSGTYRKGKVTAPGNTTAIVGGSVRDATSSASGTDLVQEFVYIPGGVYQGERNAAPGEEGKFTGDTLAVGSAKSFMPGPMSVWVKSGRGGVNGTGFELEYEQLAINC